MVGQKNTEIQKKINYEKVKKKIGQNVLSLNHQITHQILTFLDSLGCTLSVCTISFVGKILEQEILQVKFGTRNKTPILVKVKVHMKHEPRTKKSV